MCVKKFLYNWWPLAVAVIAWGGYALAICLGTIVDTAEKLNFGTFGDSFGVLNTLFSGLAFAAIWISLRSQKQELKAVMEHNEKQNTYLKQESFKTTFFSLLNAQSVITENIIFSAHLSGVTNEGKSCFQILRKEVFGRIAANLGKTPVALYEEKFNEDQVNNALGNYFRNLYHIIKYIDDAKFLDFDERKFYSNIVRAQLGSHELLLLFMNGLSEHGKIKMKPLLEDYAFLEQVPANDLPQPRFKESVKSYKITAFGENEELKKIHAS